LAQFLVAEPPHELNVPYRPTVGNTSRCHEYDPIIVASPLTAIVPLPVVIAEGRIPLAAERITTPVIGDSYVAPTIIGGVRCPIDRYVSIPTDRCVIATAKFIRVSKTINVGIPRAVHRDVSFTIRVEISGPIHRDIPIAIHP